ncbi:3'-phosphoadenosine 5'-phosphosulfate sulfotransferase (PAPS reductase)/FAD synthetase [Methanosarcinales archaeon]|nr:MAG: 3'-phosphoadenosine 5'-phosphosulfate sulfotransferase (PAPS reductase)/FAD synthetase [Methanosarcinales archaeon]
MRNLLYVASLSGGKDSVAMLLLIHKKKMPLDKIVFMDTGVEFDETYKTIEDVNKWAIKSFGFGVTTIKPKHDFIYYITKYRRKKGPHIGQPYIFPNPRSRWCSNNLKIQPFKRFMKAYLKRNNKEAYMTYIGYAVNETRRIKNKKQNEIYPLVTYNISEKEALEMCYQAGFDFYGLYKKFKRSSCWLCPFQREKDLITLKKYYPEKLI